MEKIAQLQVELRNAQRHHARLLNYFTKTREQAHLKWIGLSAAERSEYNKFKTGLKLIFRNKKQPEDFRSIWQLDNTVAHLQSKLIINGEKIRNLIDDIDAETRYPWRNRP